MATIYRDIECGPLGEMEFRISYIDDEGTTEIKRVLCAVDGHWADVSDIASRPPLFEIILDLIVEARDLDA